jgi:hypothetical protein
MVGDVGSRHGFETEFDGLKRDGRGAAQGSGPQPGCRSDLGGLVRPTICA